MPYPKDDVGTRLLIENAPLYRAAAASAGTDSLGERLCPSLQEAVQDPPTPNSQPVEATKSEWTAKNGVENWPALFNVTYAGMVIGNWNTDLCFLRGFRGKVEAPTAGGASSVEVGVIDPAAGDIHFSVSNMAEAYAYCTPRSTFSGPNNFWPYQDQREYGFMWDPSPPPNVIKDTAGYSWTMTPSFPASQYATLLNGFGYNFTNDASDVSVFRGVATLRSKSPLRLFVQATPIRLRDSAGAVKVTGPNGTGNPAVITPWEISTVGPANQITQTGKSKDTHVCFFTGMSGNFKADTWAIFNVNANNQWQVDVRGGTGGSIQLGVLCMPRAQ